MGRLSGFSGRAARRVAESNGWILVRVAGDHFVFKKPGEAHNLSIPDHHELKEALMRRLIRDMGLSVDEFLWSGRK